MKIKNIKLISAYGIIEILFENGVLTQIPQDLLEKALAYLLSGDLIPSHIPQPHQEILSSLTEQGKADLWHRRLREMSVYAGSKQANPSDQGHQPSF